MRSRDARVPARARHDRQRPRQRDPSRRRGRIGRTTHYSEVSAERTLPSETRNETERNLPVKNVKIYLKGYRNSRLYTEAVNDPNHAMHADAMEVHLSSFKPYVPGERAFFGVEY